MDGNKVHWERILRGRCATRNQKRWNVSEMKEGTNFKWGIINYKQTNKQTKTEKEDWDESIEFNTVEIRQFFQSDSRKMSGIKVCVQ